MLPLYLYARVRFCYAQLHTRPRVQQAPGLPCALRTRGREVDGKSRAPCAARMRSHIQLSSPGLTGRPQYPRDVSDRTEKPQRTGSPAFAGDDSGVCVAISASLRAERSNPSRRANGGMDYFVADAPSNDVDGLQRTGCAACSGCDSFTISRHASSPTPPALRSRRCWRWRGLPKIPTPVRRLRESGSAS
ncbi:hypothetical protein V1277_002157 [Bradyrhizobium sp. AZCC 1588]